MPTAADMQTAITTLGVKVGHLDAIVNGPEDATVTTDDGEVPTFASRLASTLAAVSPAVESAIRRELYPAPMTITMTANQQVTLVGDRMHVLNHVTYNIIENYGTSNSGILIGNNVVIDVLRIRVAAGVTDIDRFVSFGSNVSIGFLDIEAAGPTGETDSDRDGFIRMIDVRGVHIRRARFVNLDRVGKIKGCEDITIENFHIDGIYKGFSVETSKRVTFHNFSVERKSVTGAPNPGGNAITCGNSQHVLISNFVICDTPEHGIYLGGGDTSGSPNKNIVIANGIIRRAGQCGIKVKANTFTTEDVELNGITVIDSAWGSIPGRNEDGFRLENVRGVRMRDCHVRAVESSRSCYVGVYLNGFTDVDISGGGVTGPVGPCILVEDRRGDGNYLRVRNFYGEDLGSHGIHVNFRNGGVIRAWNIFECYLLRTVTGSAVRVDGSDGMAIGNCHIQLKSVPPGAAPIVIRGADANWRVTVDLLT